MHNKGQFSNNQLENCWLCNGQVGYKYLKNNLNLIKFFLFLFSIIKHV
jgi:hypothetical protein